MAGVNFNHKTFFCPNLPGIAAVVPRCSEKNEKNSSGYSYVGSEKGKCFKRCSINVVLYKEYPSSKCHISGNLFRIIIGIDLRK